MKKQIETSSLAEMKDKYIGLVGTKERDKYERKLQRYLAKNQTNQSLD